jgi:hypothetical protein
MDEKKQRYFVVSLTESDYRPVREAEFEIQVLNEESEGVLVAYYSY